ncbi:hypothetical protein Fcan01_24112 [Folsomia candida]|uniref:DUF4806 domain-containing protein n=1 Tax=Folsomia candida TaxID=158441 RepID=A0A226D7W0_FOLCA|nr:hypothetical protein Fcan01_24112 [Folsomia candida]
MKMKAEGQQLDFLTATVNQMADSVNLLLNRDMLQKVASNCSRTFDLPTKTTAKMKELETELKTIEDGVARSNEKKAALGKQLSLGGGTKSSDAAYRAMAELMSDAVAAEFSFEGRKGKLAFSSYPLIYSAVLVAVRINCPDAKRKDIDEAIKYWLKKGPSRLSRANKRRDNDETEESEVNAENP